MVHRKGQRVDTEFLTQSVFCESSEECRKFIANRNLCRQQTFAHALNPIFAEKAALAYVMNFLLEKTRKRFFKNRYRSFFANSTVEAIHGAIKLARHNSKKENKEVLVLDTTNMLSSYMSLFSIKNNIVPQVRYCGSYEEIDVRSGLCAFVHVVRSWEDVRTITKQQRFCKEKKIVYILVVYDSCLKELGKVLSELEYEVDMFVWGEKLTCSEVPFAAFSARIKLFNVWNALATAFLHSSTYGGNALSTSYALNSIMKLIKPFPEYMEMASSVESITSRRSHCLNAYVQYVNSAALSILSCASLDLTVEKSKGVLLHVKRKKLEDKIYDCVGGSGCSVFGHNPEEIPSLLLSYNENKDYFSELKQLLSLHFLSCELFPAVSGATAVEAAFLLAFWATGKRKIISFSGNYAGKTLGALGGTFSSQTRSPFGPLNPDVIFIDIEDKDCISNLRRVLREDVGLVWFEVIQGASYKAVKKEIIDTVSSLKRECDYLIGCDEILNGTYRTGNFFSYSSSGLSPDIVTISKGISYMTFPVSFAVASMEVYKKALEKEPKGIDTLQNYYKNDLGAYIALQALKRAQEDKISDNVKDVGSYLKKKIKQATETSPYIKDIVGDGLHIHIVLDMKKFPFSLFNEHIAYLSLTKLGVIRGNVMFLGGRLLPPLNIKRKEADQIALGMSHVFGTSKILMFAVMLMQTSILLVVSFKLWVSRLKHQLV